MAYGDKRFIGMYKLNNKKKQYNDNKNDNKNNNYNNSNSNNNNNNNNNNWNWLSTASLEEKVTRNKGKNVILG